MVWGWGLRPLSQACKIGIGLAALLLPGLSLAAAHAEQGRVRVWCHYVAWHDWNGASSAFFSHYDAPLAHPSGDPQRDYRDDRQSGRKCGQRILSHGMGSFSRFSHFQIYFGEER